MVLLQSHALGHLSEHEAVVFFSLVSKKPSCDREFSSEAVILTAVISSVSQNNRIISQANLVFPAPFVIEPISSIDSILVILFEAPKLAKAYLYFLFIAYSAHLFEADLAALCNFKTLFATDLAVL